jgi:NADH-quinone oxidoreductase subunit L
VLKTFFGEYTGHAHPHESPRTMTGPLVLLAIASTFVGLLGAPFLGAVFGDWVHFGEHHEAVFNIGMVLAGSVAAAIGILGGWTLYRERKEIDPMSQRLGRVWGVLEHRYYIDDFYMAAIVRPVRDGLSGAVNWTNQHVLDAVVNGAAALARVCARGIMWIDRNLIDGAVNALANITGESGGLLKYLQSGNVQWYAVGLFAGVIALAAIFVSVT